MTEAGKQISNPFSTGCGGGHFEAHVQASFVALMLTGGFSPCLPCWPIKKIKLQGKFAGYDTDDLIVFAQKPGNGAVRKMHAQIKHSISITEGNKVFGEVIQAAWNDFNNPSVFSRENDLIALITGPLSSTDINDVRTILEWARHSENAEEFIRKVNLANFSSQSKQSKLQAFRTHLKNANGDTPVSDEILFEFMKGFHLLGYDLDIKAGVTLSLIHSHIGQRSQDNVEALWARLVDEVQSTNKNAGTITQESLPDDLLDAFKQQVYEEIPEDLSSVQPAAEKPDWNQHEYASDLAIANLLGSWDEECEADLEIIRQMMADNYYPTWIARLREVLQLPDSPVSFKNGKWIVKDRKALWESLGPRIFDDNLDSFKQCILTVLTERDPIFELPPNERYAASIHGKVLSYSSNLRKGMADSLALIGNQANVLTNCSQGQAGSIAVLTVRELFEVQDWLLWGSLDRLLPVLSEAAPDDFLNAVEKAALQTPCLFDELFQQEGDGITGGSYITGLLWALESLAWDPTYLVRVCVILGRLASHDPGGQWANRPANSLSTILLPWLPQTIAQVDKRKVAVETIVKELPGIAWKLLLSLLPKQRQSTSGTHKPSWRNTIPNDWEKGVTNQEYWEQVSFYAEIAVSMASDNIEKMEELISHLDHLPPPSFEKMLEQLSSEKIAGLPEDDRLRLWTALTSFFMKHKRFSDAKWALDKDSVAKIEAVAAELSPKNPLNLNRRIFNGRELDLYEERGNWKEQQKKLEESRCQAVNDVLAFGGIDAVISLAESVDSPAQVGHSLGTIGGAEIDAKLIPGFLGIENQQLEKFIAGYVWVRQSTLGWEWVDGWDKKDWSLQQKTYFFSYLPFTEEAWRRVHTLLGESEGEYWAITSANPYLTEGDMGDAIDKLIEYGRPHAAIRCLHRMLHDKQPLDKSRTVRALLGAVSSEEPSYAMDTYHVEELIKYLQNDTDTDPDYLFQVEWAYLPLLGGHSDAAPKLLESRLASDPGFYCEAIRLIYRSDKDEEPVQEPTERESAIATNAWRLINEWKTPPGTQDGAFSGEQFRSWLDEVKRICTETGHLETALIHVGEVLFYSPPDPEGMWIDRAAADALNDTEGEYLRRGFRTEVYNSRGAHWVDPQGKPERELAEQYRLKAEEVENAGYQRFAVTLRGLAESYDRDADRIIENYGSRVTE